VQLKSERLHLITLASLLMTFSDLWWDFWCLYSRI